MESGEPAANKKKDNRPILRSIGAILRPQTKLAEAPTVVVTKSAPNLEQPDLEQGLDHQVGEKRRTGNMHGTFPRTASQVHLSPLHHHHEPAYITNGASLSIMRPHSPSPLSPMLKPMKLDQIMNMMNQANNNNNNSSGNNSSNHVTGHNVHQHGKYGPSGNFPPKAHTIYHPNSPRLMGIPSPLSISTINVMGGDSVGHIVPGAPMNLLRSLSTSQAGLHHVSASRNQLANEIDSDVISLDGDDHDSVVSYHSRRKYRHDAGSVADIGNHQEKDDQDNYDDPSSCGASIASSRSLHKDQSKSKNENEAPGVIKTAIRESTPV
jgi:hypothetical protein